MTSETILITGAAGFIGRTLTAHLAEAGFAVRAGLRSTPMPDHITTHRQVSCVACDLDDPEATSRACAEVDVVVHTAYGAPERMPAQLGNLLNAAEASNISRIVSFSSIAVYGKVTDETCSEMFPLDTPADAYGAAKRKCEAMLERWATSAPQRRVVVLRPGIVYGEGSPFWIEKLTARLRSNSWGDFGALGDGLAALVHVDDLAEAALKSVLHTADERARQTSAFNIAASEQVTWNAYFAALAHAIGFGPLEKISPANIRMRQLARLPAKALQRLNVPGLEALALAPTPGEIELFTRRAHYPTASAERALGWRAAIRLDEGMRRSIVQETSPEP